MESAGRLEADLSSFSLPWVASEVEAGAVESWPLLEPDEEGLASEAGGDSFVEASSFLSFSSFSFFFFLPTIENHCFSIFPNDV